MLSDTTSRQNYENFLLNSASASARGEGGDDDQKNDDDDDNLNHDDGSPLRLMLTGEDLHLMDTDKTAAQMFHERLGFTTEELINGLDGRRIRSVARQLSKMYHPDKNSSKSE